MRCRIIRWLYRSIPVLAWQRLWMRLHLGKCPVCAGEIAVEKRVAGILGRSVPAGEPVDLWPAVSRRIETGQPATGPAVFPRPRPLARWGWLAAASLLLGVVTLVSTLRILRQPPGPVAVDLKPPSRVVMRSATVGRRPATVYYFQSQNPDRWIVWVQKT